MNLITKILSSSSQLITFKKIEQIEKKNIVNGRNFSVDLKDKGFIVICD